MSTRRHIVVLALLALSAFTACKPATTVPAAQASRNTAPAPAPEASSTLGRIAASLDAVADPRDAIRQAMTKFLAVRSYHAAMQFEGGPGGAMGHHEIDFVAPDRYRMQMPMGTQVIIGDTMYMAMKGRTMKMPMPEGTLSQWRDPARLAEFEPGMTVQAQGSDTVDGVPARKYLVHHAQPQPVDVVMWVGNDGLPLQMQVTSIAQAQKLTSTTRYSRFDDPTIRIDPPK